jgi:WD40 repeat protein
VAVTADGRTAVSGAYDNTVRVWDLASGRCTVLLGNAGLVNAVAVTADGRTAVSRTWDKTVQVWDLASRRCTATHAEASEDAQRAWAAAASGRLATTTLEAHGLTLRNTRRGATLARFPGTFTATACSADGHHIVAGDGRGAIYILKLHTRDS